MFNGQEGFYQQKKEKESYTVHQVIMFLAHETIHSALGNVDVLLKQ